MVLELAAGWDSSIDIDVGQNHHLLVQKCSMQEKYKMQQNSSDYWWVSVMTIVYAN